MRSVQRIVETLSQEKGFGTVVLTNTSGLPLATSLNRQEAESLAAVVADMLRSAEGISGRLGWDVMSEIMLLSHDAQRGVLCRRFTAGDRDVVLAFFIEPQHAYWKATSQAIVQIKRAWSL